MTDISSQVIPQERWGSSKATLLVDAPSLYPPLHVQAQFLITKR